MHLCREGVSLERLLDAEPRSGPPSYEMRLPRSPGEAVAQGQEAAEQERRRLGIADAPIADVSELIASQGVWASGVTLPDGMSGLFLRHPQHRAGNSREFVAREGTEALFLRARIRARPPGSQRQDHHLQHRQLVRNGRKARERVRRRVSHAARWSPRFPAEPGQGLPSRQDHAIFDAASGGHIEAAQRTPARSQRITYKDNAMLAHHFGVSYQAAVYRLKSLRYISASDSGELLDQEHFGRKYLKALNMFGRCRQAGKPTVLGSGTP